MVIVQNMGLKFGFCIFLISHVWVLSLPYNFNLFVAYSCKCSLRLTKFEIRGEITENWNKRRNNWSIYPLLSQLQDDVIVVAASVAIQTTCTLTTKDASTQTGDLKGTVTRHIYLPNSVILIDTHTSMLYLPT